MKLPKVLLFAALTFALLALAFFVFSSHRRETAERAFLTPATWQHAVTPGDLSQAHAFLGNNCAACHTPDKGVEAAKCIACHADNKSLLQRQPTAFHSNITACAACHVEHQGRMSRITEMDHAALARMGLKQIESGSPQNEPDVAQIKHWLVETRDAPQVKADHLRPEEMLLNCAACHSTKDVHQGFFGTDCAQCHTTAQWTIPEFRHPSSSSQSCAQCHQAPPSHYMMHFQMIDQKVCGQPNAKVNQCFICHQTTSWNDIKGIGWYKMH